MSGASTMFTKSKAPSVAHWWRTFAPSSSTSWFTWRSRSGFDLSVWTPCWLSVERRMNTGTATGAYSGRLVDVEQRPAEVEERAQDELREEDADAQAVVALAVEERAEHVCCHPDDDDERAERAERVHVVGHSQPAAADERLAEAGALDHRRGHGEADQGEPREPGQDVERAQRRE